MTRALPGLFGPAARLKPVADLGTTPVLNGVTFDDAASARSTVMGEMQIVACLDTGHAVNAAYDDSLLDYDADYDNSLHFSPTFQAYADRLAARLVDTYALAGGRFVEIGSGKGDFLESITRLSGGTGFGYDPSTVADRDIPNVTLVSDLYRPGRDVEPYDLLICRHVLEHLEDPEAIIRSIRAAAPPDAIHYFEVPAAEFDFGPTGMWDLIYPHVGYFSRDSLHYLMRSCGFEIVAEGRSFADQFLWVEVRAGGTDDSLPQPSDHLALLDDFAARRQGLVDQWLRTIADRAARGEHTAMWGAGSKGVAFLNAVDPDATLTVVDLNSRKWGRYLPGTGHQVVEPSALVGSGVSEVVITNPAYRAEITRQLADLGVAAEVVVV